MTRAALRAYLASRPKRCDPGCPGWFINDDLDRVERCDDCAHANGLADDVDDSDIEALPEVRSIIRAEHARTAAWLRYDHATAGCEDYTARHGRHGRLPGCRVSA